MSPNDSAPPSASHLTRLQRRLTEAFEELCGSFVDPEDAFYDVDGTRWNLVGQSGLWYGSAGIIVNEQQLAEIRTQCRILAVTNEFAINGHENRISYIVGSGHSYRAFSTRPNPAAQGLVGQVQDLLDEFVQANHWHKRQQEIVRRKDRDGECFLRLFAASDGSTQIRFVEPGQVATPPQHAGDPAAAMGIQTQPGDVETVLGYWIDGRLVGEREIQHRKANVDGNVRRGLPLFYPVRKNLRRADKLLRNMSAVAQIQSSIALIRKHQAASGAALDQFVRDQADFNLTNQTTGRTAYLHRYAPGTILDTAAGTDYEFPAAGLDAARYVTVLQAELRAIASRLVMPEFMLSSDASNANYASTMVAEGPAVKMFERLQNETIEDDLQLLGRVLAHAVETGRLPHQALAAVDIQAVAPTLAVRDRLQEAQADQILVRNGAMSRQTMAMRHGLEPDREQQLIAQHAGLREANFNPDEPRDERGRWTTGGGAAGQGGHTVSPDDAPYLNAGRRGQLARAAAELDAMVAAGKISKKERDLRYELVKAALGHKMKFNTKKEPNPAYFEKRTTIVNGKPKDTFHIKPGQATEGIHDRVYGISGIGSETACTPAARSLMLEAQAQQAKKEGKTAEFEKDVAGKTLPDLYPSGRNSDYQTYNGNSHGIAPNTFAPGDRVWMQNHMHRKGVDKDGYEGSNVIYAGKDDSGVQQYVHMDGGRIADEHQLKRDVHGYSDPERQDPNIENYKFKSRYSPKPRSY